MLKLNQRRMAIYNNDRDPNDEMWEKEQQVQISINKEPSFTEIWYEGAVDYNGEKHQFWLIHPQGVDPHGNEYELDVRWFFQRVPREIRAMHPYIIDAFKQKLAEESENGSYDDLLKYRRGRSKN
jgi:hypothetical protein